MWCTYYYYIYNIRSEVALLTCCILYLHAATVQYVVCVVHVLIDNLYPAIADAHIEHVHILADHVTSPLS